MTKSRNRMNDGYAICVGKVRNAHKILFRNPDVQIPIERHK